MKTLGQIKLDAAYDALKRNEWFLEKAARELQVSFPTMVRYRACLKLMGREIPNTRKKTSHVVGRKLDSSDVKKIKALLNTNKYSMAEIGRMFCVSREMIRLINENLSWQGVGNSEEK